MWDQNSEVTALAAGFLRLQSSETVFFELGDFIGGGEKQFEKKIVADFSSKKYRRKKNVNSILMGLIFGFEIGTGGELFLKL